MTVQEELLLTLDLIRQERIADLEQYRQKVLLTPLNRKTKEGICWYPVRIKKTYIGTGERQIVEVERTQQLDQPHIFQSGKLVSIFCNANGTPEKEHTGGVINYVRDNMMVITMNADELPEWFDEPLIGVDVMFDEMTYREMEAAMKQVMKADDTRVAALRDIVLGTDPPSFEEKTVQRIESLNPSQEEALRKVLSARDIGIIHGPPGTGKTTTLVQAIKLTVREEGQALVCAPSNAAVDLLADKLSEEGLSVLRIGHPARVTDQTLSKTLDARIAAHAHYKELKQLRKKIGQLRETAFKFKRRYGHAEREQRRFLLQESRTLKADADVLEFYIINDLLQNSDVVTCTLVGVTHPVLRGKRYKSAFIDEAAQAVEPACWIPFLKADRIIMAGDHCQLPPTIKSIEAARKGLDKTLFEKCIQRNPTCASMLQIQYRMHEDIMEFSSKYFYRDELVAHESVKNWTLDGDSQPVEFIDTAGCGFTEAQDAETLSRYNTEEAHLLIRQVEKLLEGYRDQLSTLTLGIITPYRAQVELLKKLIDSSPAWELYRPITTVNTVDAFQGQERDVVAISLVRSNDKAEVGFLADIRRTNVAMTRAKKKLILVGDSATLASHTFYAQLLDFIQERNFYKSAWEVMY